MTFKLSKKQLEFYQSSYHRISILSGSVRSGKSFISLLRLLLFLQEGPKGDIAICARTERTALRNIINPLYNIVGNGLRYAFGRGIVNIYGKDLYLISCNDRSCESKLRGSTLSCLYIDEGSLVPEDFIKMGLSRLSIEGAQCFITTNPDSPHCYLKKGLIDRAGELDVGVYNFTLEDNPSLSQEYKDNIRKEYTGLYYRRFILSEWCQCEGAVYDFFSESNHVIKFPPGPATKYIVGIDYGTTNACAFILLGYNKSLYPNMWVEREYYYDSKIKLRQKTDAEYADDLQSFLEGIVPEAIYIDPSAASFKQELFRRIRHYNIVDADNNVLDGIRFVSSLLSNGTLKICCNCTNIINEFYGYSWDEKSALTGVDKVKKGSDHALDALRYACFSHFYNLSDKGSMTELEAMELERKYAYR